MTNEQAIKKIQAIIDCDLRELNTMPQHEALQNEVEALDMAIKALEQQPSDDVMAIHTQGLAEGIRCAMCTNSMKSDKGCDGGCVVDNKMYKKVMDTIHNHIFEQPTSDDCVSRQATLDAIIKELGIRNESYLLECERPIYNVVKNMPPVALTQCIGVVRFSKEDLRDICNERIEIECTHGTCKDCRHWKDSDGVYRRGVGAESKCPVNNSRVFEGTFCCADFIKRGNENEVD